VEGAKTAEGSASPKKRAPPLRDLFVKN